jgi:ATPase subunit of ABC transporter with duplicated ATPase domains
MPLIQLRDVTAGYDSKPIVKGITLNVKMGDRIAIVGLNGQASKQLLFGG